MASYITGILGRVFCKGWLLIDPWYRSCVNASLDVGGIAAVAKVAFLCIDKVWASEHSPPLHSFQERNVSKNTALKCVVTCVGALLIGVRVLRFLQVRRRRGLVSGAIRKFEERQDEQTEAIVTLMRKLSNPLSGSFHDLWRFRLDHRVLLLVADPIGESIHSSDEMCLGVDKIRWPEQTKYNRLVEVLVVSNLIHLKHIALTLRKSNSLYEWIVICGHGNTNVIDFGESRLSGSRIEKQTWEDLTHCTDKGIIFQCCHVGVQGGVVEQIARLQLSKRLIAPIDRITLEYIGHQRDDGLQPLLEALIQQIRGVYLQCINKKSAEELGFNDGEKWIDMCPYARNLIQMKLETQRMREGNQIQFFCYDPGLPGGDSHSWVKFRVFEPGENPERVKPQKLFRTDS